MEVAIYDDDVEFSNIISDIVKDYLDKAYKDYNLYTLNNVDDYKKIILNKHIDVIFLDIDMPKKNGIEVAEELRNIYDDIDIIFLTNREDLVFQSIHYAPFRFLRKSKIHNELIEAISAYVEKYITNNTELEFIENGNIIKIIIKNIKFIESDKHYASVFTKLGEHKVRSTISELEMKLYKYGFIRVQRSFIINMACISKINNGEVILYTGENFPIKRGMSDIIRKEYYEYKRKRIYGNTK
jgi:DNA-binding LytR/AlgR family response regulator